MKIEVTQEDIEDGIQCSNGYCPIALALKRSVGPIVKVHNDDVIIGSSEIALPTEAQEFIESFDDNLPVSPFTFEINFSEEKKN